MILFQGIKKLDIKKFLGIFGIVLVAIGLILMIPGAFSDYVPVKSITIESTKLDYSKSEPGSYNIEKSAKWIQKGKARITFNLNTVIKTQEKFTDIIFVLDVSGSMNGDKLNRVKQDSIDLINTLFSNPNNRGALITFEDTSQIILPLTNNKDDLVNTIGSLATGDTTNYYQALVNVDKILKTYKKDENRDCIVLFLTDGYPNVDVPNEKVEYKYLKKEYPYLTINGIQYEMGKEILDPIKGVSDQQFSADIEDLNNVLFEASVAPITYDNFSITDYINDDYFEIDSVEEIVSSIGTTKLEYENNIPKVVWDIKNLRSGTSETLTIDVKLKKEYLDKGGLYPTNKKEDIKSLIDGTNEEITSEQTPVLRENYQVIYDSNAPSGCNVSNMPTTLNKSVFETVKISDKIPVCEGYHFKEWAFVTDNVDIIDNYFTMPEEDVLIRAIWDKLTITKNVDGEIFSIPTLYKTIAKQAVLDNTSSEFVTSDTGINFNLAPSDTNGKGVYTMADTASYKYPVHYFRGEVENNNVKFAGFCWKMVRTTETGGVKLIYNGVPNENGGCTSTTGTATQIGTSAFSVNYTSPADVGYMYGKRYNYNEISSGVGEANWYNYIGRTRNSKSSMGTTEYYYGDSVVYDESTNTYTLTNIEKYLWSTNYSKLKGKYTCFKDTEEGCQNIAYLDQTNSSTVYYVEMVAGEDYQKLIEQAKNYKWVYGNDVSYIDGKYVLKDTQQYSPINFDNDKKTGFNAHRYTCFTTENSCESVSYLYFGNYYINLHGGQKIEDAVKEMLTDSSNTYSSNIKKTIDTWYENNMLSYTKYLEDTVWCNDRSMYGENGWSKDSSANAYLYFGGYGRNTKTYKPSLECINNSDKFTVSTEVGNGKLTYPIALLTADEVTLAGSGASGYSNKSYLYTGQYWWLMTPNVYNYVNAGVFFVYSRGNLYFEYVPYSHGVRVAISLVPGIMVKEGDGTASSPYQLLEN